MHPAAFDGPARLTKPFNHPIHSTERRLPAFAGESTARAEM
jgi:hypothetical protein